MLYSGLVSITFRQLSPREIVDLVGRAGVQGIEWGGDVHVPHGEREQAAAVARLTADAGLAVAAYGSYYRAGHPESGPFEAVLETAVALGAPRVRIWAGRQGSAESAPAYFDAVVEDTRRCAELSRQAGIDIVYEFHGNTLTDDNAAARRLLEAIDHPALGSYWQPPRHAPIAYNQAGLDAVLPWLAGLHVFHWHRETGERLPLAGAEAEWLGYLRRAHATGRDLYALVEFVQEDEPDQFLADATALQEWLEKVNGMG